MSLILDALNRSRQDVDQVPGLATQHYADAQEGDNKRRYLPWFGLLAALLVIAWLLVDRRSSENIPAVNEPAPAMSTASSTPAAAALQASPGSAGEAPQSVVTASAETEKASKPVTAPKPLPAKDTPGQAASSAVADLYQQTGEASPVEQVASRESLAPPEVPAAGQAVVKAAKVPAAQSAGQQVEEQAEEQTIDIEKMVLQAREEMENARLEEHSAPFISDLSQQTKDAIPTIYYERHDYSGDAAQSSVVLNGKKVKAGGSVAAGVTVEEVLPDSVVLSYRGTQFRLRALNSWINL